MTDEQKANDASRYLVVSMDADAFSVLDIVDSEGEARSLAEKHAAGEGDPIIGVYQKIGTARLERKIAWKGAAA